MKFKTDDLLAQASRDENHSSISSAEKTFSDEAQSGRVFSDLKVKLANVDEWNAHSMLSSFKLFDERGQELQSNKIGVGVFMRISLTGTLKYDWVGVRDIHKAADEFIITVAPTFDPTDKTTDKSVTSHFFTNESNNNFCLLRKGHMVALYVIGLNEKMNTDETESTLEKVRNAAVNAGSYFGLQSGEWEKFCHHFMEDAAAGQAG
jgi:hypothetical protein